MHVEGEAEGLLSLKPLWYQNSAAFFLRELERLRDEFKDEKLFHAIRGLFLVSLQYAEKGGTNNVVQPSTEPLKPMEMHVLTDPQSSSGGVVSCFSDAIKVKIQNDEFLDVPFPEGSEQKVNVPETISITHTSMNTLEGQDSNHRGLMNTPLPDEQIIEPDTVLEPATGSQEADLLLDLLNSPGKRGRPRGDQPDLSCKTCGRVYFNKRNLEEHEAEHVGKQFSCVECGKAYAHQRQLKRHVMRVHEARAEPCVVCGARVKSKYAMSLHLEAHQKGNKYPCRLCNKEFSHERRLKLHVKNVHQALPSVCDICGKVLKHSSLMKAHMRKHEPEGTFVCDLCPKTFRMHHLLDFHRKRHFLTAKFQCSHCGKRFKTTEGFKKHEMSHTGNHPFKCKDCDKSFAFVGELNFHARTHSNDRRYTCPVCPKAFFLKKVLRDHMNTHTGERPYVCDACGDSFAYGAALRNHKRLKHKVPPVNEASVLLPQ